jgi:16S rRNA (guanine527-N7)-methyltransferase
MRSRRESSAPPKISPAERDVIAHAARTAAKTPEDVARIENLFRLFLEEVLGWTRDSNLVAHGDLGRLASRHLVESLASLPLVDRLGVRRMIDLGSGGGFPAIPILIARPELEGALVESRRRKGLFLQRAVRELGLERVAVRVERAEHVEPTPEGRFDLATARAVAPVKELLGWMSPVVRPGGHALLYKGSSHPEEIQAWEALGPDEPGRSAWELQEVVPVEDRHLYLALFRRSP